MKGFVTFSLPEDLHAQLKQLAADGGTTMVKVVAQLLRNEQSRLNLKNKLPKVVEPRKANES